MIVDVPADYPAAYLACPICKATAGNPCRSRSGSIAAGIPDQKITALPRPHIARKRSKRA